jgi:hypothetical protein
MQPKAITGSIVAALMLVSAACNETPTGDAGDQEHPLEPGHAALSEDTDVNLGIEAARFQPGAEVTLVLENHSEEDVGHNLCFHALERRSNDDWAAAEEQEDRVCTLVLHILPPGDTARYDTTLPDPLPAGEYRYRVTVHFMDRDEHRDQASDPFQVEG